MKIKTSKTWNVLRWILFLPLALLFFGIISYLADSVWKFNEYAVIVLGAVATAGSICISKVVTSSPRVAISLITLATLVMSLLFLDERRLKLMIFGWPVGVVLGFLLSTRKGPERKGAIRALRWILFLPAAIFASGGTLVLTRIIFSASISDLTLVIALGVGSAIFVCVGGLLAPSHRSAVVLLIVPLTYSMSFFLTTQNNSHTIETTLLIAWAIGTAVGTFVVLKSAGSIKKPLRDAADTENRERRYKGTAPYQDHDLDRKTFFGRDHESRSLLSLVLAERLVVLFAKSGMGKSSLINAGLVEPLRERGFFPIVVRLNDQIHGPTESLIAAVHRASKEARVDVLGSDPTSAWRLFKTAEFWSEENDLLRPVVILDQFEEIFTLHNPAVRQEFIRQLGALLRGRATERRPNDGTQTEEKLNDDTPPPNLKIVIALREDFLANLEELAKEIPAILHNRFRLGPLSQAAAREAIVGPAHLADNIFQTARFTYQEEAVKRMIAFLAKRQFGQETKESDEIEPVQLQLICHYHEEMVRQRQAVAKSDSEIEISEADLGGEEQMQQVMEGFYDRTLAALTPRHKARAVQHLCEKRLVSSSGRRLTEDHDEIKRRFKLSDKVLRQLVDARLLRAESRLGGTFYEVSHDRLIEPILKSRNKRLIRQRWLAIAALPLLVTVSISWVSLISAHQERKARTERYRLGTFDRDPINALQSIARLTEEGYNYEPEKELLEEIQITSVLNPATLVILAMLDRRNKRPNIPNSRLSSIDLTDQQKNMVIKHIEKHHEDFLDSEFTARVPTLLGALLYILDEFEETFESIEKKRAVLDVKKMLVSTYKENYASPNQGAADNLRKEGYSYVELPGMVTDEMYALFFKNHKLPKSVADRTKAVRVSWFAAYAYSSCMGKKLPSREDVEDHGNDIALKYEDMLRLHNRQTYWRRGWGLFMGRLTEARVFRIYLN